MQLYGLKNCDTCRKALKHLPDAELVDVRAQGVPADVLGAALQRFGADLVNTRSTTWRGLDENQRALPHQTLLEQHPTLMKRPVIEADGALYLGWGPEVRGALIP